MDFRSGLGTLMNKRVSHLSGASKYDFPVMQNVAWSLPNILYLVINTDMRFFSIFEIHTASQSIYWTTTTKIATIATTTKQQQQQQLKQQHFTYWWLGFIPLYARFSADFPYVTRNISLSPLSLHACLPSSRFVSTDRLSLKKAKMSGN